MSESPKWPREIGAPGERSAAEEVRTMYEVAHERYPDRLFRRGDDELVYRHDDRVEAQTIAKLTALVHLAATFVSRKNVYIPPGRDLISHMVSQPQWYCRELAGVVTAPYLSSKGEVVEQPGYSRESKLWLEPAADLANLPLMTLGEAQSHLRDLIGHHPLATAADQSHALGLYVLPWVREAVAGPTPLHLIASTQEKAGKTYLARCATALATAAEPATRSCDAWTSEASRQLTSALAERPRVLLLDNLPTSMILGWADLHRFLSASGPAAIRPVGAGKEIMVDVRCVWVATANHVDVDPEQARRSVLISIMPSAPRPTGEPILARILRDRRTLVSAMLTVIREWVDRGRPRPAQTLEGFDSWSDVVGGIVNLALGTDDWLSVAHRPRPAVEADWCSLFRGWAQNPANDALIWMRPGEVADLVDTMALPVLGELIGAGTKKANSIKMGRLLMQLRRSGRVQGGWMISAIEDGKGWWYMPVPVQA